MSVKTVLIFFNIEMYCKNTLNENIKNITIVSGGLSFVPHDL